MPNTYYNEERDVTIELSARQSGKTSRLIQKALRHIGSDRNNMSVIITHDMSSAWDLRRRIRDILNYDTDRVKVFSITNISQNNNLWHNVRQGHDVNYFFDEFEQYQRQPPLLSHSYYTSTPRTRIDRSRTHLLLEDIGDVHTGERVLAGTTPFELERTRMRQRARELREEWTIEEGEMEIAFGENVVEEMTQTLMDEMVITTDEQSDEDSYLERLGL